MENNEYNDLHAALVDKSHSTTLDKPWSNEWLEKSFLHRKCWLTIEQTHSALINLTTVMALFHPCTAWIKGLFVNPTFHSLHLPRRWLLCDGAVHLCVASMLQGNSDLASDSGSFHMLLFLFGHSLLHRSFFCLT